MLPSTICKGHPKKFGIRKGSKKLSTVAAAIGSDLLFGAVVWKLCVDFVPLTVNHWQVRAGEL
jgi:hypothetical protein